jgi:hypothetical protein
MQSTIETGTAVASTCWEFGNALIAEYYLSSELKAIREFTAVSTVFFWHTSRNTHNVTQLGRSIDRQM